MRTEVFNLGKQEIALRFTQWALPIILFLVATGFEIVEHLFELFSETDTMFPFNLTAEIILFGILVHNQVIVLELSIQGSTG